MADYFESGFCVRQPSWHRKETLLEIHPETWVEAREHAGLGWDYLTEPLFSRELTGLDAAGDPVYEYVKAEGHQVVKRSDTREVLASSRDTYEVIGNHELGEILHALTDKTRLKFETAGSVRGGRTVWALVRLGEDVQIGNDPSPTRPYLGIVNHCDKAGACKAFGTSIRMVCWNTVSAAEASATADGVVATFRHTANWREHLEAARTAILGGEAEFQKWVQLAEHLQEIRVSDTQAEDFVREFNPYPHRKEGGQGIVTERVAGNIERARTQLREVLWQSKTSDGIQGTAYWLFQGAAEYLDHLRDYKTPESYVQRTVVDRNKGKALAFRLVSELVGV